MGRTSKPCINPDVLSNRLVGGFMAVGKRTPRTIPPFRIALHPGKQITSDRPVEAVVSKGRCGNVLPKCRRQLCPQGAPGGLVPVTLLPKMHGQAPGGGDLSLGLLLR